MTTGLLLQGIASTALLSAGLDVLWPIYLLCLVVGGGLLIVSTVLGGDHDIGLDGGHAAGLDADLDLDVDVDADLGLDVHTDVDVHTDAAGHTSAGDALSLSKWFSLSFVVYFTAVFGLFGTLLTWLSGMAQPLILGIAAVAGLSVGQGVHQLLRYLKRSGGNSLTRVNDYMNRPARVTVAMTKGRKGEVAVDVRGHERFLTAATCREDDTFTVGDDVVITDYRGGTALVVSQKEHTFLAQDSREGGTS